MKRISLLACILLIGSFLYSQDGKINNTAYYRTPFSLGLNYTAFNPLSGIETGTPYNIFDLSGNVRYTFKALPLLQAELSGGMSQFDSQNTLEPDKWDSVNYFGLGGFRLNHKTSKTFEFGLGLSGGMAQGIYENLDDDPAGVRYALGQGSIHIGLSPSYNMSIELVPALRYQYSLDPVFKEMDGLFFGIGGTISFRFGKDPDSPDAAVKNIRFSDPDIQPLFAAMQSYYRDNPLGSITIENTGKSSLRDLTISFFQSGFMDGPTIVKKIDSLEKGEPLSVPLTAVFNKEIFLTEGITPLTGEVKVSYTFNNRPVEQTYPVSYDLYDKTSLIWDDDTKVAAFITPADSALQNYTSFIRKSCKEDQIPNYNEKLQGAVQIYHALNEIGCIYQADPLQPFASVSDTENMIVDSVSLSRRTLSKLTGDCDDLTVMYLSLLETIGIPTAFITVPGHIYTAFNTGADARSFGRIHPDRDMTINIDGELWIPLEITLLGKTGFLEAWKNGAEQWNKLEDTPEKRRLYITAEAQKVFRPIGLTETDLGLQYGSGESISMAFRKDMSGITDLVLAEFYKKVAEKETKQNFNRLGIALAEFNSLDKAREAFLSSIALDGNYLSPRVNLANLEYLNSRFNKAIEQLNITLSILEKQGRSRSNAALIVNLNLSKAHYAMEHFSEANEYFKSAEAIDRKKTAEYSYLASVSSGDSATRAAEQQEEQIIFLDEEE